MPTCRELLDDRRQFPIHVNPAANSLYFVALERTELEQPTRHVRDEMLRSCPDLRSRPVQVQTVSALAEQLRSRPPGPRPPVHGLYHLAFGGSTLLSRILDTPGICLGLREPHVFDWWAEVARFRPELRDDATLVTDFFLSRGHERGEPTLVKPTNQSNLMLAALLEPDQRRRAVLLVPSARSFFHAIYRRPERLWWMDTALLPYVWNDLPRDWSPHLRTLTTGQRVAASWMCQLEGLARCIAKVTQRVLLVTSERLFTDLEETAGRVSQFLGLAHSSATITASAAKHLDRHAKTKRAFDPSRQTQQNLEAERVWAVDLRDFLRFLDRAGVPEQVQTTAELLEFGRLLAR